MKKNDKSTFKTHAKYIFLRYIDPAWQAFIFCKSSERTARYGRGFHRSRKMLGHDGEWFGLQGSLFYHLVLKRKKFPFKIFFKSTKCFISDTFCQIS